MSAKKLGRFTAGLFVALGLAIGGLLAVSAGDDAAAVAANTSGVSATVAQKDFDWS